MDWILYPILAFCLLRLRLDLLLRSIGRVQEQKAGATLLLVIDWVN
ncbi:hypothetical protein RchiOBHm_Chr4g0410971 [Rosa chinensis]|uniref:Uncharacterized protein n=1 Tax=Rosa chinensis TaxID=74649 RepID=A0A2P6QVJ6_ROSCH|nr:hypothetical protein RchiOBHm_Chr4g0410971 [Rosa chinensis]